MKGFIHAGIIILLLMVVVPLAIGLAGPGKKTGGMDVPENKITVPKSVKVWIDEKSKPVDVDLINRYFFRHDPKGQRCPKCGLSLEGMDGPYGVYVQCGGILHHRFKLDQI